jgi:hypothetical protein
VGQVEKDNWGDAAFKVIFRSLLMAALVKACDFFTCWLLRT